MHFQSFFAATAVALMAPFFIASANGQNAQLKTALGFKPKQIDVDYDQPTVEQMADCKMDKSSDPPGFVIVDGSNRVIRRFLDNNKDGKLDQWSYYKNGMEVYRDIDSNFDQRTDQYRWIGSGGTRWGLDPDQNGTIDSWKFISAEELAFEVFQAIKTKDAERFGRTLITDAELQGLKLGDEVASDVRQRLLNAKSKFAELAQSQKQITAATEWVHASHGMPAMAPAGAHGNKMDLVVYDHASAVFKSADYGQLALGTLIQIGPGNWRATELPEIVREGTPINNGGVLFPMPHSVPLDLPSNEAENSEIAKLYNRLSELEKELSAAEKSAEIVKLEESKAEILEEIFLLTDDPERKQDWLENISDSIASAYQSNRFPGGLKFLEGFASRREKSGDTKGLDYLRWRSIFARYGRVIDIGNSRERDAALEQLVKDLTAFQADFKTSPISADALCQLGVHYEISNDQDKAIEWYSQTTKRFPDTNFGKRAAGALVRLQGKGKTVSFIGEDIKGAKFSLSDSRLRDKIVVLHFWETWCTDGLEDIQRLVEKYKDDVVFIGCNIDKDTEEFKAYLAKNKDFASWPHLHAPGSVESSPLAQQLGISSEPMVLVFDGEGKLVESDIPFSDIEREIERLRRQ